MYLTTHVIVTNQQNELLLVRRADTRTWAPPGGGLDLGELPPEGARREVLEETGIRCRLNHLAAIYYWPNKPHPYLTFSFRGEAVGGTLTPSPESPQVSLFPVKKQPLFLLPFHKTWVRIGLTHQDPVPYWGRQTMNLYEFLGKHFLKKVVYRYWRWQRLRATGSSRENHDFVTWHVQALCLIYNEAGQVLWHKPLSNEAWHLPGGDGEKEEAPWETAVHTTTAICGQPVKLTNLSGVYLDGETRQATFLFEAKLVNGRLPTPLSPHLTYTLPQEKLAPTNPIHLEYIADAAEQCEQITFKFQPTLIKLPNQTQDVITSASLP